MRRTLSRAARALAACASATVLLTGCGVRGTGVVQAGGPATVAVVPFPPQRMLLFFLSSQDRLMPVARPVRTDDLSDPVPGAKVLAALLAGPTSAERAAGLHTGLPRPEGGALMISKASGGEVLATVPFAVRSLTTAAVRQLVCTMAHTEGGDGIAEVTVRGTDGPLPAARC
ncbi:hypothetical protein [Streptomyces sp. NK08204]|uniref:hypothetical protein n=1 Tax=Streptomyces sp. NK08204 TaxID=2873260 RepID=UPI001CECBE2D|nr:hypothetical protein [Streptomyces sp. NK08204]